MTAKERECRSCGAPVYWLKHAVSGKLAPIDADPSADGNIDVDEGGGTYTIIAKAMRPGRLLHTNHFATCESAGQWHKT